MEEETKPSESEREASRNNDYVGGEDLNSGCNDKSSNPERASNLYGSSADVSTKDDYSGFVIDLTWSLEHDVSITL